MVVVVVAVVGAAWPFSRATWAMKRTNGTDNKAVSIAR